MLIENVNPIDPDRFPIVLIGNKSDLPRAVTDEEAREWCGNNHSCPYFETQAINGVAVEEAFFKVGELATKIDDSTVDFGMPEGLRVADGAM